MFMKTLCHLQAVHHHGIPCLSSCDSTTPAKERKELRKPSYYEQKKQQAVGAGGADYRQLSNSELVIHYQKTSLQSLKQTYWAEKPSVPWQQAQKSKAETHLDKVSSLDVPFLKLT